MILVQLQLLVAGWHMLEWLAEFLLFCDAGSSTSTSEHQLIREFVSDACMRCFCFDMFVFCLLCVCIHLSVFMYMHDARTRAYI